MKKHIHTIILLSSVLGASATFTMIACDDDSSAIKEPAPDSGASPGIDSGPNPGGDGGPNADGGDGGPTDCVTNPKTHLEIINACTNATKITKNPTLNKLLPDGGLPPLL